MTLAHQLRVIQSMLSARDIYRAARADFATAVQAAREAGVTDGTIADELLRDSVLHGELDPVLSITRDIGAMP